MHPNTPLAYAPRLELHNLIISKLGESGGQLEAEREGKKAKIDNSGKSLYKTIEHLIVHLSSKS